MNKKAHRTTMLLIRNIIITLLFQSSSNAFITPTTSILPSKYNHNYNQRHHISSSSNHFIRNNNSNSVARLPIHGYRTSSSSLSTRLYGQNRKYNKSSSRNKSKIQLPSIPVIGPILTSPPLMVSNKQNFL